MKEQDEGLEMLSESADRLSKISLGIHEELGHQNKWVFDSLLLKYRYEIEHLMYVHLFNWGLVCCFIWGISSVWWVVVDVE